MTREQEILNELNELSSPLAGYSRAMPFEVPKGYFETLADDVTRHASVPPAKENPFAVPEGYFDALPAQLLQQVAPAKKSGNPSRRIWLNLRHAAVAALIVVAVGVGAYRIFNPPEQGIEEQLGRVQDAELIAYVREHAYEFETETLISNLQGLSIEQPGAGIGEDAIEAYLETGWQ